jgi:serine protease Do
MKKTIIILGVIILIVLLVAAAGYFYVRSLKSQPSSDGSQTSLKLSQNDIVALAKPAIVYVVIHIKGKAVLPSFSIDFTKGDVISNPAGTRQETSFDNYFYGSGFIVNSNGYILTNSHVASYQTLKLEIARQYALRILLSEIQRQIAAGNKDLDSMTQAQGEEMGKKLAEKSANYILSQGQFEIDKKMVVLDPTSSKEKIVDLFNEGIPAKVLSINDDFSENDKDIALIKIDQANLPSLKIGDSNSLSVGSKINVIGFPASAEFNQKNIMEATFSAGNLTAVKDSQNKDFKIFQTDAKISQGSSGSPMIDEAGNVLGVITYQASDLQRDAGDNFAFALPINLAGDWIKTYAINRSSPPQSTLFTSDYSGHFFKGLLLFENNRGKRALAEFQAIKGGNIKFSSQQYITPYIEKCNALIASGKSIDTLWDEKKAQAGASNSMIWYVAGGGLLVAMGLLWLIFFLLKRLKKNETEIQAMEETISHNPNNTPPATPAEKSAPVVRQDFLAGQEPKK